MSKRLRSKDGTTLLEVMVAVAIASIAFIALISLVVTTIRMEDYARRVTKATLVADRMMKDIENKGSPELGRTEGPVTEEEYSDFSYRIVTKETSLPKVREVDLEILWDNERHSVTLSSYVSYP
jgi:general secretion pathway protein I